MIKPRIEYKGGKMEITTHKTEVSGSSPEWPTILYGRQNSYFFL